MVKPTSSSTWSLERAYTLIEVTIVLAIVAFMGLLTIYGFSSQNKDQRIVSSQRELLANLRSLQTKIDSGAEGDNVKVANFVNGNNFYMLDGVRINLPPGVTLLVSKSPANIYFSHPAYPNHSSNCVSTNIYFACAGNPLEVFDGSAGHSSISVGFTGSTNRFVRVDGSGMNVNRIYESTN